jgi:C-terminal processing protease CtpA/Prc
MNRKVLWGIAIAIALLLAGAGVSRSQNPPEPPEPPDVPDASPVLIMNDGYAHLGVTLGEVTPEKAQELKLPAAAGAIITGIEKDSPAARAGLEKGDVIVEFDATRVRSGAELRRLIRETPAGRTVAIKFLRGGQAQTVSAKLEGPAHGPSSIFMPEIAVPPMNLPDFNFVYGPARASLGITGDDLTSQLAQYFGVKQGKGVLVSEVMVGSAAEKSGLKAGDVIVQVDGKPVSDVDELRAALNENFSDDTRQVHLTFVRDHREQTLTVELTRSAPTHRRVAKAVVAGPDGEDISALAEEAAQVRINAEQLRQEVEKQRELMQGEWQRQLRDEMRELKEQLKNQQNLLYLQPNDHEI